MEYVNRAVEPCAVQEPRAPHLVEMSEELIKRLTELVNAASNVTRQINGEIINVPNGGEGPFPARMSWCFEAIIRTTETLRRASEFLG